MKRVLWGVFLSLALVAPAFPRADHHAVAAPRKSCGLTTLQGTIDLKVVEDGTALRCGPGQKLVVRKGLAKPKPGRAHRRHELLTFAAIADVQLADEESPLRAEWADKCEEHPASAAFRPHETMVPHLMNAHVRAANQIARRGGPVLGSRFSFAIGLGDLADNNHFNEIRWIIDIFDGRQLVDPDSGADGYDGFQSSTDPLGAPNNPLTSPVEGETILNLANEPFWAPGLRPRGKKLRWYSLPGNHDVKVQGTMPNTPEWREFANAYAQGSIKWTDLPPDKQQQACSGGFADPDFWMGLAQNPGGARTVPPDEDRRLLSRKEWVREHFDTTGIPDGHGYNARRCRDRKGKLLERACYSFIQGRFHFIGIDSNPDEGLESGNVDRPQFRWLKRELRRSSKRYFSPKGEPRYNRRGRNRLIVVFSHHPLVSMDNDSTENSKQAHAFKRLLLRFPNVIMHANGHTHQNRIWPRRNKRRGTRYWEVNTSAIVDLPHQSRTIEIADNRDGTLSIFAVVFDALTPVNARNIDWALDDPTDETAHGHEHATNELWLASAGREIGIYDPQTDLTKLGKPKDRNVELLLPAPRWFRRR